MAPPAATPARRRAAAARGAGAATSPARRAATALGLTLTLAGCAALGSPPGSPTGGATASSPSDRAVTQAQRRHEYPSPPPGQPSSGGAPTAVTVIEAFATGYINWRAATISRTMRALEVISIGQARSEVSIAASQTAQDYELRRGGVANSGVVEAIGPVVGRSDQYAVVTREQTTATNNNAYQGLPASWHLTLATVTRLRSGGWVISGWQPES